MNLTPCTTCDWYRRVSHAGADCDMHERLATLAHNLAVAAFGAAMFKAGDNYGFHMGSDESQCTCQWAPGRGEPYRGATRCEQDEIYDESGASLGHAPGSPITATTYVAPGAVAKARQRAAMKVLAGGAGNTSAVSSYRPSEDVG